MMLPRLDVSACDADGGPALPAPGRGPPLFGPAGRRALSAGSASGSELNVPLPSRFFCVGLCRYSAIELPPELLYDFPQVVSVVLEITPNLFETRRLGFRFFLRLARLLVDHGAKDRRAGRAPLIQIKGMLRLGVMSRRGSRLDNIRGRCAMGPAKGRRRLTQSTAVTAICSKGQFTILRLRVTIATTCGSDRAGMGLGCQCLQSSVPPPIISLG